ncbi:hypothetical protein [Winogradskyella ouciana]|uniref:hypothetical protein n=1 Tax=Winogradskyella ouciana TaxID=2608631 RepID=UPI003D2D8DA1
MFNQRKNKRFNYKPRFQDSKEKESRDDLEAKWDEIRGNTRRRGNRFTSLPALILILAALFILIYVLNGYIK